MESLDTFRDSKIGDGDCDTAATSIIDRALAWRNRWKYQDGSIMAIHLREPEEIVDSLIDEIERLRATR